MNDTEKAMSNPIEMQTTRDGDDRFADPRFWEGCLGKRVTGYLVDLLVFGAIWFALGVVAVLSLGLLAPVTAFLWAILPLAYHTLMVSGRGATIGQRFAGLRVVDASTGENPSLIQAFLLACLFYISLSFAMLPLLYVLFDAKDRFLHDLISNTRTLRAENL
ncbi:RDD family protein [Rhodospirillaceae bacterium KN72]|uniref:RDD family protein n=1 Tax=Pacificispira spongiicola TaxID=2729598 RepID=A0A7Y0DYJ3_9PROT|nr:RDD family protein [Pacificispira spongiicola]NMM43982.1 RDD family protein [Pacificispira spongiicola]